MLEKMAVEFLISAFWELVDDEENTLDSSMVKSKKNLNTKIGVILLLLEDQKQL
mgnify:CR=1 FL=1